MAWPTDDTNIVTTNLDAASDSPATARADIKTALDELANVINGRGQADGVAPLGGTSKIAATYLPNTLLSSSGVDLTLQPDTNRVQIEDVVNLTPLTLAQLNSAIPTPQEGDIAYCTNGNAGSKTLVVYNGTDWKVVALGATAATS
jgi:hypothetical protein